MYKKNMNHEATLKTVLHTTPLITNLHLIRKQGIYQRMARYDNSYIAKINPLWCHLGPIHLINIATEHSIQHIGTASIGKKAPL